MVSKKVCWKKSLFRLQEKKSLLMPSKSSHDYLVFKICSRFFSGGSFYCNYLSPNPFIWVHTVHVSDTEFFSFSTLPSCNPKKRLAFVPLPSCLNSPKLTYLTMCNSYATICFVKKKQQCQVDSQLAAAK